jgi:hypothetical protein
MSILTKIQTNASKIECLANESYRNKSLPLIYRKSANITGSINKKASTICHEGLIMSAHVFSVLLTA